MRALTMLLMATGVLAACAPGGGEDFTRAFERMQNEPGFLATRVDPRFRMVETLVRGDASEPRPVPCSFDEITGNGWHVLPAAARLAATGTAYGSPEQVDARTRMVTLGPAEGGADARYRFVLAGGVWRLAGVEVFTHLDAGEAAPPLACGAEASGAATPDAL